jgi:4-hydroxymandelate oxidase
MKLAASPLLPDPLMWAPMRADEFIESPKEAINVFDFELVCRKNVPPAHFGYMASGIDDEVTLRANREGFLKFQLRPRRLVDVSGYHSASSVNHCRAGQGLHAANPSLAATRP